MSDGSIDPSFQIKDLDTGEILDIQGFEHMPRSNYMEFKPIAKPMPDGIKFIPFLREMKNYLFDLHIKEFYKEHNGSVRYLKTSKDGKYIASGDEYGIINLWIYNNESLSLLRKYDGHKSDITCLDFSSDGLLLSSSLDKMVKLWHPIQSDELAIFQHDDSVTAVAFHPKDSSIFLSCSFTNTVYVWNIKSNEIKQTLNFESPPTAATFSPDGNNIAIGCLNGFCFIYSYPDFKYVTQFVAGPRSKKQSPNKKITSIEYINDNMLLISTNDSRIRLFSMENFQLIRKFIGHISEGSLLTLSYSSDGKLLMIPSEKNSSVFIWPIDHENFYKSKFLHNTFCRERSKTCQGFTINKHKTITSSIFLKDSTITSPVIHFADSEGFMYLVVKIN